MEWNAALEAVVRANPEDPAGWSVLEDWTLEQGGLRAVVLERLKAGDQKSAQEAVWALERELFGEHFAWLQLRFNCSLRAGYAVKCWLKGRSETHEATLERVLPMRCSALMTAVSFDLDSPDHLEPLLRTLSGRPLRELSISAFWKPTLPVSLDANWLGALAIERLHLIGRAVSLPYGPEVSRLTELWITPAAPEDLGRLFERTDGFPRLVELVVYVRTLEHRHGGAAGHLEPLLIGRATPALRRLHVRDASPAFQDALIERLATSPLLPRLERFSFGHEGLDLAALPERHRSAFAHLQP